METLSHTAPARPAWPVIAGIFVLLLLFAFAAKLLLGLIPAVPDEDAARSEERTKAYAELQAENKTKLETYAWVDKAQGHVQIPISRAMELTIAQINSQPPSAAGPINPPAAPAPAASPEPVAPAPSPTAQPSPTN